MIFWNSRKHPAGYRGEEKAETFDFSEIAAFYHSGLHKQAAGVLSDQTCSDLGLEDLFMFTDRTASRVGQQYLYNLLRIIPAGDNEIRQNEQITTGLTSNPELQEEIVKILSSLKAVEAYSIAPLIHIGHPVIPNWQKYIFRICSFLPALSLALMFLCHSGLCLWLFIFTILINGVIHYRNKPNCLNYLTSIPQLIRMFDVAKKLCQYPLFHVIGKHVSDSLSSLETLKQASGHLRIEAKLTSDMAVLAWAIAECFKIFFLAEPLSYIKMVRLLKDKNQAIENVFRFVGLVDSLSSVAFLRKSLPYYCIPESAGNEVRLDVDGIYHPLIENCIANSIRVENRSILFTGSNMSGKTTFIRTMGVNVLVAQTLNTAFARTMKLNRPIMIEAALMLSDNLQEGKSFYLKEVESIREMLNCSRKGSANLFLLDEIFKGTNTTERIAAAKAVLSYLNTAGNIVFVSTHDTELGTFLEGEYDLYHFCETIQDEKLSFDYKLKSGNLYQRNAIRILEINDYPVSLISDAYAVIDRIEKK